MDLEQITSRLREVTALEVREAINIHIAVFSLVLSFLFFKYVIREAQRLGYRNLDWPAKLSIGLFFVFFGELLRSSTIWIILHTEHGTATYVSNVGILFVALGCVVIGGPCVVRVMAKWRSTWVVASLVALILMIINHFDT